MNERQADVQCAADVFSHVFYNCAAQYESIFEEPTSGAREQYRLSANGKSIGILSIGNGFGPFRISFYVDDQQQKKGLRVPTFEFIDKEGEIQLIVPHRECEAVYIGNDAYRVMMVLCELFNFERP